MSEWVNGAWNFVVFLRRKRKAYWLEDQIGNILLNTSLRLIFG